MGLPLQALVFTLYSVAQVRGSCEDMRKEPGPAQLVSWCVCTGSAAEGWHLEFNAPFRIHLGSQRPLPSADRTLLLVLIDADGIGWWIGSVLNW